MATTKLTAKNLKETLNSVREGRTDASIADSVACQAREILRTTKIQLQISRDSKRDIPADVISFNEG